MVEQGITDERKQGGNWWEVQFEEEFRAAVEKLRGPRAAGEFMPLVCGLVFLKYLSDAFTHRYAELLRLAADSNNRYHTGDAAELYALLENPHAYTSEQLCWVPATARWGFIRWNSKHPTAGRVLDEAMAALEQENPALQNMLPRGYARAAPDAQRLFELMTLISGIGLAEVKDEEMLPGGLEVFPRVFQFLLDNFVSESGAAARNILTPPWLRRLLLELTAPPRGSVYDPCCGFGISLLALRQSLPASGDETGTLICMDRKATSTSGAYAG